MTNQMTQTQFQFKTVGEVRVFLNREKKPLVFRCAHCQKCVTTNPAENDTRWRFCSRRCEKAFWRHNHGGKGRFRACFKLGPDGILREI